MGTHIRQKLLVALALLACSGCGTGHDTVDTHLNSSPSEVRSHSARTGPTTVAFTDPRGDVVKTSKEADWFEEARPAPRQTWGDIIGTRVRHTARQLVVQVRFVTLQPQTTRFRNPLLRLGTTVTTNTGLRRDVEFWIPDEDPTLPKIQMLSNSEPFACHLSHTVNADHGIATLRIPRTCLGTPKFVRVAVNCLAHPDDKAMSLDLALLDGYDLAREDTLSPAVHQP